jgi:hypothetical protein
MMRLSLLSALCLLGLALPVRADSPLTSTPFSQSYTDLPAVQQATLSHELSSELITFLSQAETPLDQKLAVVNALGWNLNGQHNHQRWLGYLRQHYQHPSATPEQLPMTAEEQLLLGYLMAMDNYFEPRPGLLWLRRGARQLWQSQAAQWILALTEAQDYINRPDIWCQAWLPIRQTLKNPDLKQDLRPSAQKIIVDYMRAYQDACPSK